MSIAGGVENAPIRAHKIGAKAFAMFTRNQRQWQSKPLTEKNIKMFKENCKTYNYNPKYILPHASYLINLGSPSIETFTKSKKAFTEEMKRCSLLGLKYLNVHPGAHLNKTGENDCLNQIADAVNETLEIVKGVTIVCENTAGEGTNVGYRFEHLAKIIEMTDDKKRIGVCIDTCHMFAAGYDIRSREAYEKTFDEFDKVIGFNFLKGMHLNDAKSQFASRVDRHNSIGMGNIGIDAFRFIMNDKRIDDIPMILETTNPDLWQKEIEMLYGFIEKHQV